MNNLVPENTSGGTRRKTVAVIVMAVVIAALTVAMAVFLCIGLTHRHTMAAFAAKDATCTEAGNAQYWYCAGCDTCFADEKGSKAISFSDVQIASHGTAGGGDVHFSQEMFRLPGCRRRNSGA